LYGREAWRFAIKKEHKLKVIESSVLGKCVLLKMMK
jgi:hypothetical protein